MEGLGLDQVATPAEAEFVLNTGPDDHRGPTDVALFEDVLADCARHSLPMICANPDLEVIRGGVRVICAGALAERASRAARRRRSGRSASPTRRSTARCWPCWGRRGTARWPWATRSAPISRGRRRPGLDSCWVLGGIHGEALAGDHGAATAEARSGRAAARWRSCRSSSGRLLAPDQGHQGGDQQARPVARLNHRMAAWRPQQHATRRPRPASQTDRAGRSHDHEDDGQDGRLAPGTPSPDAVV